MSLRALVEDYRAARSPDALHALGTVLVERVVPVADAPTDPLAVLLLVEDRSPAQPGTWQEVRACRDLGLLSPDEYDYLSALYDATH